jgi:hypothetical protein
MQTPAVIALLGVTLTIIVLSNYIYHKSTKTFYLELYKTNNSILSSDRDFYQASEAAKEIALIGEGLSEEQRAEWIAAYNKNSDQALSNIHIAMEVIGKNDKLMNTYTSKNLFILLNGSKKAEDENGFLENDQTLAELAQEFEVDFQTWKTSYNPETGEGDYSAMEKAFNTARENLDYMGNILTEYGEFSAKQMNSKIQRIIYTTVVIVFIIIVVIYLLYIYILY